MFSNPVSSRLLFACVTLFAFSVASADQIDIHGPVGEQGFGADVKVLPNGNIVIAGSFEFGSGSVFLYSPDAVLISRLRNALKGPGSIHVLADGNFVVCSPGWQSSEPGSPSEAGAVTWVDGAVGLNGEVSIENSLVGTKTSDSVCGWGVAVLPDGAYVVKSPSWSAADVQYAGAATWCPGQGGCVGAVSSSNSLVGTTAGDFVGRQVEPLTNGNYVVTSPFWSRNGIGEAGAVTLCQANGACNGQAVSEQNSLVGSQEYDFVGMGVYGSGVVSLSNGDFVVASPSWRNGAIANAGAATLVNGSTGLVGSISAMNSLVGSRVGDFVSHDLTPLAGGSYVVSSPFLDNDVMIDAGAMTYCEASIGCVGEITESNSVIGSSADERLGTPPATALSNGNYVIASPRSSVNGPEWSGAVTLCIAGAGCTGRLSPSNSLVGTTAFDAVGANGVTALENGNYVVNSGEWDSASITDAGAATFCSGASGCTGVVSTSNSLVGTSVNDRVGSLFPSLALSNGNYVVSSNSWHDDNGSMVGALTWADGKRGMVGTINESNSFVGNYTDPGFGGPRIVSQPHGNYVLSAPSWANGGTENAGAMTLLRGYGPQTGTINSLNSVLGTVANEGSLMRYDYDSVRDTLVVGKQLENVVTLLRVDQLFFNGLD